MIESYYWRRELKADIKWLRAHMKFRRWTEKQMVLFERRLILAALQVRVLIEQHRVRSSVSSRELECAWHRKIGTKPVTRLNSHRFHDHFDMAKSQLVGLDARSLSNQLIHHYEMHALAGRGQFEVLAVFSDYARNKGLYFISIPALVNYFAAFADDQSAVSKILSTWNPRREDYDVVVD